LLDPKTYFKLEVQLTDEFDLEIPGSTGETYSAIALLGIARLSFVQAEKRKGLRFIILEEIGSLDNSNFNTFPAIAKEFDYQIITMAPHPFRTTLADDWYAHHLIKGKKDKNINFAPSASYFKTKDKAEDLRTYLQRKTNELDSTQSA
jgi:exonuclease SbcC